MPVIDITYLTESSSKEVSKDVENTRKFVTEVRSLAKKYNANFFIVTDGASGYSNGNGGTNNPAVKAMRQAMDKWELDHGFDPKEDWSK